MVNLNVKKDWIFERDGVGKGPSISAGDFISCDVPFSRKLISRGVATISPANSRDKFVPFPPPVEEASVSDIDRELNKLESISKEVAENEPEKHASPITESGNPSPDRAGNTNSRPSKRG